MEKLLLSNGMRILLEPSEFAKTATVAVFIRVGSRYENEDERGLTHFVEHMLYKGTPTRTALQLAQQTDLIGGQSNAYTTKEYTCVYIRSLTEYDAEALELVGDIVVNPLIADEDVEVERGVILEEIAMYEDSPEDLAGDGIYEAVWGDDPLGRTIIGLPESIRETTAEKIRDFHRRYYRPDRMVLAVSGKYDRKRILDKAEQLFGGMTASGGAFVLPPPPVWLPGGLWVKKKETQQVHIVLGYPSPSVEDNRNVPLAVLNSIIGGGGSSRLFQRIREELGLAYSVYSFQAGYAGAGCFSVSLGISPDNQQEALSETLNVLKVLTEGVTDDEFLRAKNQMRAGIAMSYENTSNLAMGIGRREIYDLPYKSEDQLLAELEAVTHEEINQMLSLLDGPVCLSAAGQTRETDFYQGFIGG